jgi:hypothetical protein
MRRYSLILILAVLCTAGGCQLMSHVTGPIKQSLSTAADDYHHVTTGTNSRYIESQGR